MFDAATSFCCRFRSQIGLVVRRSGCVTAAFRTAVASDICRYIGPAAELLPG
jgi:hypothetical protein